MSGWTAAGNIEAARVGANNLLHWRAIQWARANGGLWYESGEAFPGTREGKLKGLNDFKRSFGGELYPIYRGYHDLTEPEKELPVTAATSRWKALRSKISTYVKYNLFGR